MQICSAYYYLNGQMRTLLFIKFTNFRIAVFTRINFSVSVHIKVNAKNTEIHILKYMSIVLLRLAKNKYVADQLFGYHPPPPRRYSRNALIGMLNILLLNVPCPISSYNSMPWLTSFTLGIILECS